MHDIAIGVPSLNVDLLLNGLDGISPLLATAIPLGIYNFTEAMSNVESAAAAGDSYNLRSVLLADGTGAIVGAALGCPFPPAVYIGHPGWKAAGGRVSLLAGQRRADLPALRPRAVPAAGRGAADPGDRAGAAVHRPGDRLAGVPSRAEGALRGGRAGRMVPNLASWGTGLVDNALAAAGTSADKVGEAAWRTPAWSTAG